MARVGGTAFGGAIFALLTALSVLALPAPSHSQATDKRDETESRLIQLINSARAERSLPRLNYEPRLTQIARELTRSIYAGQRLNALSDGLERLLQDKGYPSIMFGGRYATTDGSVSDMLREWLEEGGPDSILINPNVQEIGVAYLNSDGSTVRGIPTNIWAVVIAEPARPADADWRRQILRLVNQFRAANGLDPLKPNAFLDRAAMGHARDMLARDFFSHINPSGIGPGDRATAAGYKYLQILENIAIGQRTPREVVNAWVASKDGHREAMLNPSVTELGIGYVFTPFDPGRITSRHYWSMSLGRPQ